MGQSPLTIWFCPAFDLRIFFLIFLNGQEKNKGRRVFFDMWKVYEIQISVSIHKVLLEHSHIHSSLAAFCYSSCKKECMVHSLKYLLSGPLWKKNCRLLFRESKQHLRGTTFTEQSLETTCGKLHFPKTATIFSILLTLLQYDLATPSSEEKESSSLPSESGLVFVTCLANTIWWKWLLRLPN